MADATSHRVRFEPVGIEMDVEEGETVLDAAFRQGISRDAWLQGRPVQQLQIAAAGGRYRDAEILNLRVAGLSSATPSIFCSAARLPISDITVELLNYDEDLMRRRSR